MIHADLRDDIVNIDKFKYMSYIKKINNMKTKKERTEFITMLSWVIYKTDKAESFSEYTRITSLCLSSKDLNKFIMRYKLFKLLYSKSRLATEPRVVDKLAHRIDKVFTCGLLTHDIDISPKEFMSIFEFGGTIDIGRKEIGVDVMCEFIHKIENVYDENKLIENFILGTIISEFDGGSGIRYGRVEQNSRYKEIDILRKIGYVKQYSSNNIAKNGKKYIEILLKSLEQKLSSIDTKEDITCENIKELKISLSMYNKHIVDELRRVREYDKLFGDIYA
jgi:hypothetical protein